MPNLDPLRLGVSIAIRHALSKAVIATGAWQVHTLAQSGFLAGIDRATAGTAGETGWGLTGMQACDPIGAQRLWDACGGVRLTRLRLTPAQDQAFARRKSARQPLAGPSKELSAKRDHAGFQALASITLAAFLISVVLSHLSAQHRAFSGEIFTLVFLT